MALGCPRCGTQNPDGNAYCQACGTPLAAPVAVTAGAYAGPPPGMAPPGPPPGLAPPPVAPGGYQSPYFAPPGPVPAMHRTPWFAIIAGVVALTLVMAGAGTALALIGNHSTPASSAGIGDAPPTPTPGVTPSPVASPTSAAATGLESNDGFSLTLPSGWTVESKDNESMVVSDPNDEGSVTIASGTSFPTQTAQQNKDTVESELKAKFPDTRECGSSPSNTVYDGVSGISFTLCFTLTSGANSVPAAGAFFTGANSSGNVYYLAMVITEASNLQSYVATAKPVLQSVRWKLS